MKRKNGVSDGDLKNMKFSKFSLLFSLKIAVNFPKNRETSKKHIIFNIVKIFEIYLKWYELQASNI